MQRVAVSNNTPSKYLCGNQRASILVTVIMITACIHVFLNDTCDCYHVDYLMTPGSASSEAMMSSLMLALALESSLRAKAIIVMATIWLV